MDRNFPSLRNKHDSLDKLKHKREEEVKAVIEWVINNPFVLSASFQDGAVVASYPNDAVEVT